MSSTILTVFLEGIFINEAFYHEIEHRIFELEPWKSLEDNPEIEIEAFAYSTGILFRFRSFSVDLSQIQEAFDTLKEKKIPDFSISEKKRFLRELQDRKMDQEADFDEWAGAEFLKSFEIPPILENIQTFGDFISRISIVTHNREGTLFYENRLREISQFPKVQKAVLPMKGELFHSYILFPVQNTLEAVSSIIFLNAVRSRLKKLFREPGESYDICMGLRFEGSYLFADYFWRGDEKVFDPRVVTLPLSREEFQTAFQASLFDARLGHEDRSFGLNAILSIFPEDEIRTYESITFEKYSETISRMKYSEWGCGDSEMSN